jgi:hypothetical protein
MNPESKNSCNPYALPVFPGISQISLQVFSKKSNELLQSSNLTLHNQFVAPDNQAPVAKITLQ